MVGVDGEEVEVVGADDVESPQNPNVQFRVRNPAALGGEGGILANPAVDFRLGLVIQFQQAFELRFHRIMGGVWRRCAAAFLRHEVACGDCGIHGQQDAGCCNQKDAHGVRLPSNHPKSSGAGAGRRSHPRRDSAAAPAAVKPGEGALTAADRPCGTSGPEGAGGLSARCGCRGMENLTSCQQLFLGSRVSIGNVGP